MDVAEVTKMIADTLNWAIGQAGCPAILDLEIRDSDVILFDTIDGGSFSLTVENLNL